MKYRRKLILGAVALVAVTFILTSALFLSLSNVQTADLGGFGKFFVAVGLVKKNYVENVPASSLIEGALKGMVSSLKDPYSLYLDPKLYEQFTRDTEGSFGGIGIVMGVRDNLPVIISPIEGTPGEQAGLKSGDIIQKVDGKDTADMPLDEVANAIRGPRDTQVVLTIKRASDSQVKDYVIIRTIVQIKTVKYKMLPNSIGYIRISTFNENTSKEFLQAYQELEQQGMKGTVLDLRDNPGGLLEECVRVAQKIVPQGPIVSVVRRDGSREIYSSHLNATKYPLVALVNEGSASASEIVAGALQDTGAGQLVGMKTYGKGSVQSLYRLNDNTALKLTIAKYLTPSERSINGVGIVPDVVLQNRADHDDQLDKAIQMINERLQNAA